MKTKLALNSVCPPQTVDVPLPLEVHPSVSPLAAELLMKTVEEIGEHPEKYNQCAPTTHCGSPCCIVGWMEFFRGEISQDGSSVGLTRQQYVNIFHYGPYNGGTGWPSQFKLSDCSSGVTPQTAIARIEHFLRTGE